MGNFFEMPLIVYNVDEGYGQIYSDLFDVYTPATAKATKTVEDRMNRRDIPQSEYIIK